MFDAWGISWGGSWATSWGHDANGEVIEVYTPSPPGGHWKHLFKPIKDVAPSIERVEGTALLSVVRPTVTFVRDDAAAVVIRVAGVSRVAAVQPFTGVRVVVKSTTGRSKVSTTRPKASSRLFLRGVRGSGAVFAHAASRCSVEGYRTFGYGVASKPVVKTVQNLPDEVLLAYL